MAGQPYAAGGIRVDRGRHPGGHRRAAARQPGPAGGRAAGPGHHDVRVQVRLRPDRRRRGPQRRAGRRGHPGGDLPGRACRRRRSSTATRRATSTWSAAPMLTACAPHARWVDVFCERGAFGADEARAVLAAGQAAGLLPRVHANQLGPGPGIQVAVAAGAASADHCTYTDDADVAALAGSGTVATLLPGVEFSTRQPYPDARRLLGAGRHGGHRHRLQPGLLLHLQHAAVHRARRPGDADDHRRRRSGRPRPAARGRCAAPTSATSAPAPAPTWSCSTPRRTPTWPTGRASRWSRPSGGRACESSDRHTPISDYPSSRDRASAGPDGARRPVPGGGGCRPTPADGARPARRLRRRCVRPPDRAQLTAPRTTDGSVFARWAGAPASCSWR